MELSVWRTARAVATEVLAVGSTPPTASLFGLAHGKHLLIRFSGTEPLIRVYTETTHQDSVQALLRAGLNLAGLEPPEN